MLDQGFFAVRCGPCYGTGFQEENTSCSICKGDGLIPLAGTFEDYIDCQGCGGSGFNGFNQSNICSRCDGIGAIRKPGKSSPVRSVAGG